MRKIFIYILPCWYAFSATDLPLPRWILARNGSNEAVSNKGLFFGLGN